MKTHLHFFIFGLALLGCEPSEPSTSSDSSDPATGTGETETETDPANSTGDMPTTSAPTTGTTTDEPTGTGTDGETELPDESDTDETTGGDEPMCGDGIVDEGEACDDGILADDGPCVMGCHLNVCGDGYVHAGVEVCDAGEQNGMYGGSCSEECTTENIPHCGDGVLQEGYETCEEGEQNGDGVTCDPNHCQWGNSRYIFISSATFRGNLESNLIEDGETTGVKRADDLCQILAIGGGLPGSYYAWLSDNNGNEISDVAARMGGAEDGADVVYVMPKGGVVIANGWDELVSDGPAEPIIRTESGGLLEPLPAFVWTNTSMAGTSLTEDSCNNWTSVEGFGSSGYTTTGPTWTSFTLFPCDNSDTHLYCVQGKAK